MAIWWRLDAHSRSQMTFYGFFNFHAPWWQ